MPYLLTLAFIFFAVIGASIYITTLYNALVALRVDIDKAWANIDVLLKQRYDEITRLVEVCKGYMQYERETLAAITEARARFAAAVTVPEKAHASSGITASVQRLYAAAENYPQLKASETFLTVQKRITELENQVADRREFYNDVVTHYNIRIQAMPDLILAWTLRFKRRPLFQVPLLERAPASIPPMRSVPDTPNPSS